MSKINCIIVEDEPLAAKVLTDHLGQVPFLVLQATFKDAILANEYLRENTTDLIFLDIHLPKLKGMAFLKIDSYTSEIVEVNGIPIPIGRGYRDVIENL